MATRVLDHRVYDDGTACVVVEHSPVETQATVRKTAARWMRMDMELVKGGPWRVTGIERAPLLVRGRSATILRLERVL